MLNVIGNLAMAGGALGGHGQKGGLLASLVPLVVIFGIFYFLLIRPQQKQQKKHREMVSNLKKGEKVVTRGGMHGTIHGIADNIITLELAEGVHVKFNRDAVAGIVDKN